MKVISLLRTMAFVPALALTMGVFAPTAGAVGIQDGADSAQATSGQTSCLWGTEATCAGEPGMFKTVTDVLLFIIGAIAVIMLIIGGIRYTISGGDSNAVTSAKNTILYAIVGIVVALLAYAIISWVVGSFDNVP